MTPPMWSTGWDSFVLQLQQMIMPVMVLALQTTAQVSRYMRASMLDNLGQDYVRTARAKGMSESVVVHEARAAQLDDPCGHGDRTGYPVDLWRRDHHRTSLQGERTWPTADHCPARLDIPMVMTMTFILAVLIVMFNLIADVLYGVLDPRIRYD